MDSDAPRRENRRPTDARQVITCAGCAAAHLQGNIFARNPVLAYRRGPFIDGIAVTVILPASRNPAKIDLLFALKAG